MAEILVTIGRPGEVAEMWPLWPISGGRFPDYSLRAAKCLVRCLIRHYAEKAGEKKIAGILKMPDDSENSDIRELRSELAEEFRAKSKSRFCEAEVSSAYGRLSRLLETYRPGPLLYDWLCNEAWVEGLRWFSGATKFKDDFEYLRWTLIAYHAQGIGYSVDDFLNCPRLNCADSIIRLFRNRCTELDRDEPNLKKHEERWKIFRKLEGYLMLPVDVRAFNELECEHERTMCS